MAVRADGPVVNRRARSDPFNMNEVERLIVRRIAVKMEKRQRRRAVLAHHGFSINRSRTRESQNAARRADLHKWMMSYSDPLMAAFVIDQRRSALAHPYRFRF